ncbi:MAG: zinc ribbon domain-containing protein [Nocardioides sp.]
MLGRDAGRRQNKAVRDWAVGQLIAALRDKAEGAGVVLLLVDERGTSSTCPACHLRVPRPRGRAFACPHPGCGFTGHRDLVGAANIAARAQVTDRRNGRRERDRPSRAGHHAPSSRPPPARCRPVTA